MPKEDEWLEIGSRARPPPPSSIVPNRGGSDSPRRSEVVSESTHIVNSEIGSTMNDCKLKSFREVSYMPYSVLHSLKYLERADWDSTGWVLFYEYHIPLGVCFPLS